MKIDLDKLRALWTEGVPVHEIGVRLGCSRAYASAVALRIGLPRRAINGCELPGREIIRVYTHHRMSPRIILEQLRPRFPTLHVTTIRNVLRRAGVIRPRGAMPVEKVAECVRLARQGLECREIGRRLGLTPDQVEYRIHKVMRVGSGRKTNLPLRDVRSLRRSGKTCAEIASVYGVRPSTISYHIRKMERIGK